MDTCSVVPGFRVAAAVFDDKIYGLEAGVVTVILYRVGSGGEETATDAASVVEGFELGRNVAEIVADVVVGVDFTPLL